MAGKTLVMQQIRNILQQRHQGLSYRKIADHLQIARNTVRHYLRLIDQSGYSLPHALALDDEALGSLLFEKERPPSTDDRYTQLQEQLPHYASELKKRHVTRYLLWEEYQKESPDGYGYTQFCYYLNQYIEQKDVVAVFSHRPAEKLMIDFAGAKLSYIDRSTGEEVPCQVLITVLPFSSYMYAEAMETQKQDHLIEGLVHTFEYLGGVTESVLCDNMKSAVKRANRYEPVFTDLIDQLAVHYQTTFMATRVRKPRDKAAVESAVKVAYQRLYAKLRNQPAYNLAELNAQIRAALTELNNRNFKGRDYSRSHVFQTYEQPKLKPLPSLAFEVKKTVLVKVQRNYHIVLGEDRHQYSVPHTYAGKQVKATYTTRSVEIYHEHQRIAFHARDLRKHGYSTQKNHMPAHHQAIDEQKGWDADYFLHQGTQIGPCTHTFIARILTSKVFVEQTYNTCLGILRLTKKYGPDRLEAACTLMQESPRASYGVLDNILKNNMDKRLSSTETDFKTPTHGNIRGPQEFS